MVGEILGKAPAHFPRRTRDQTLQLECSGNRIADMYIVAPLRYAPMVWIARTFMRIREIIPLGSHAYGFVLSFA